MQTLLRKRLLAFFAAALLPVAVATIDWSTPAKPGVNLENFRRLRPGMTKDQVEMILGRAQSPGDPYSEPMRWVCGNCEATIIFHQEGAVCGEMTDEHNYTEPLPEERSGVLLMMRRWVRRSTGW